MRIIRRIGSAAVAAGLMSAFVSGPATAADRPESYVGSAAGRALNLQVGQNKITLGQSMAQVDSTLKAVAESAGVIGVPVSQLTGSNAGRVEVSGNGTSAATGEKCAAATPEAISTLAVPLSIGAGCSSSAVQVVNNLPVATGIGKVAAVDLDAQTVIGELPIGTVQAALEPVFGTLAGLEETLGVQLEAGDTVNELLTALGTVRTLEVRLGDSTSTVTTDGSKVTSVATSQAGTIAILPLGAIGEKPVAEIIIGSAKATAVYDRATGVSTPSFDPAIVTVRINTPTTDAITNNVTGELGIDLTEIVVTPGTLVNIPATAACDDDAGSICVLKGTPFETKITVASGRTVTNADGSVGAIADGVAIHALRNIGQLVDTTPASVLSGGVLLELAHAEAGVGGLTPQVSIVPELPRELPRTGGFAILPMLGAPALAAAIIGRRLFTKR